MEIIILVPLATMTRCFEKGDVTFWADEKDAQRLIKAGYAKPAKTPERK